MIFTVLITLILIPFNALCLKGHIGKAAEGAVLSPPSSFKASSPLLIAEKSDNTQEMDAYDPFTDYSEFENPEDEAKDIRFFKKGRFLSIGIYGGMRFFTGTMSRHLDYRVPNFGFFFSYFFNLTSAFQFSSLFSSHPFTLEHQGVPPIQGNFDHYSYSLDFKYYLDKEKLIPFIAFFNPHIILGFTVTRRAAFLFESTGRADRLINGYGFRSGLGLEMNFSKRFYTGVYGDFNYTTFPDEAESVKLSSGGQKVDTGIFLNGDMFHALIIFGVNF